MEEKPKSKEETQEEQVNDFIDRLASILVAQVIEQEKENNNKNF